MTSCLRFEEKAEAQVALMDMHSLVDMHLVVDMYSLVDMYCFLARQKVA